MKYILTTILYLFIGVKITIAQTVNKIDSLQYPKGYPDSSSSVINQLQTYPIPRYLNSNKLQWLFNWMDPFYMGGRGQKGINEATITKNSLLIQKELITNWHYGIVIPNSGTIFNTTKTNECPSTIDFANQNPNIPLHLITFWMAVNPKTIGRPYAKSYILNQKLDSSLYFTFDFYGKSKREITYQFPDSLIKIDGLVQKNNITKIIKCLTRPINLINENGEEPPGPYQLEALKSNVNIIKLKNQMNIDSWSDFIATRKLQMRKVYTSTFMDEIPELKSTKFTFYTNEGGPINCFEWHIMKKIMTPIDGKYYSTPDFYPRWPMNWKNWNGPWHGWKWIEIGRTKEIIDGDNLFSPFVAAGWSKVQEEDIRPAQWLGLLKCLAGVGAEFYYVGYFSLGSPFTNPAKWTWQAAMPSYAQAITSRFEDVLKDGNVLFNEQKKPIITYSTNDNHVLITIRKHNNKEKYVICGTYQPFSNEAKEIPENKNVTISFANQKLSFEVRRQGSVYVYEKTPEGKILFYQLDKWHENAHPDYWSKDFYFEAEVADTSISNDHIYTNNSNDSSNFTNYTSYISLDKTVTTSYHYTQRDSSNSFKYVWVKYKGEGILSIDFNQKISKTIKQQEKLPKTEQWKWHKIKINTFTINKHEVIIMLNSIKGVILIDKLVITSKEESPTY